MDLNTYLSTIESAKSLSRKTGIIEVLISQWRRCVRPVPVSKCIIIENATNGQVGRRDLRPNDWHEIWPELIEHDRVINE